MGKGNWFVIYTRSRAEKKTAASLEKMGVEVYCPLRKTRRKWSDRWKWVEEPLFTSYLFIRIEESRREEIFNVPSVVRYVYWLGKPAKVRDEELDELRKWLGEYEHESISILFKPKDEVRVSSGPLMDVKGMVVQQKGQTLILFIEGIGAEVRVDLRKNSVDKLRETP